MKTKGVKIVSAALLLSVLFCGFVSCRTGSGPNENTGISDISETQTETEVTIDVSYPDFGGYEFKIITSDYLLNPGMVKEIGAEEENGDLINDAVYKRNGKIEELYNIAIKEILHDRDALAQPVIKSISAGDNSYDLICGNITQGGIIAQKGGLIDLNQVGYLDLKKPWYDQNAAADLSIGHKLYFAVGELQISDNNGTWCLWFNKDLFKNLGFADPYTLVRDGKWTMDKCFEFASAASRDLNGDGKMDEEDQWGMMGESFNIFALMNGSGTRFIQKDENDLPYYAGYTQRDADIFEKGAEYLGDAAKSILVGESRNHASRPDMWIDFAHPMYASGKVLFFFTSLAGVTYHRGFDTNFGILPIPKYDETQKNYVNTVSVTMASALSMTVTLNGELLDRAAIIADALSEESMHILTPAYYELQLKRKLTRDDESAEMLDIIFENRIYSTVQLYNWGGIISTVCGMLTSNNRNFVSSMEKIEDKIKGDIEKTLAVFELER
ncbi:MAG: ABC transporter substrate-binding protein [Oscillospiraceae bacterium]|nr:ABC transporter substrate-binding protein [Oscillospiraceae bacterium]